MIFDFYHSGSSVNDLSIEYGVSNVTVYKRIKDLTAIEGTDGKEIAPKDVDSFQKENFQLKRELKIFKKLYMTLIARFNAQSSTYSHSTLIGEVVFCLINVFH